VPGGHRLRHRREGPGRRITFAPMERAYRGSTRVLSALLVVLGIAMVVSALARGGGALAVGVVAGVLFALLGAGRLVLAARAAPPRERS
jgi:hypothetical protein